MTRASMLGRWVNEEFGILQFKLYAKIKRQHTSVFFRFIRIIIMNNISQLMITKSEFKEKL